MPVHVLTLKEPFGPSMTLEIFLNQALDWQYPSPLPAFSPPEKLGEYFVELAYEPALVHLATGVRAYAAGASGLAAGLENGDILVWSDWPCPALTLPEAGPVDLIAWDGASAFLGASDFQRGVLHLYDLRFCAHVGAVPSEGPISTAAVSSSGIWVALVDQGRRLWAGTADGPLRQVGVLRFHPLALAFSPREGLFFTVDQAGWLLHWTLPELQVLEQTLIPLGPFSRAVFEGRRLLLEPVRRDSVDTEREEKNAQVVWDIPTSKIAADPRPAPGFTLEAGLLIYQTIDSRWLRKMHLGHPQPRVWASPSANRLRLRDVDGVFRCYSALDGLPVDADECRTGRAEDWEELEVHGAGQFHWGGVGYALADPVMVRDGRVLYCRHLPAERFFFWWDKADGDQRLEPGAAFEQEGQFPVRESLRMEIPPAWVLMPHQQP